MRNKRLPWPGTATLPVITILLVFLVVPEQAPAETATGCHCFRDRTYDPARKFAADDYLLASTFNSLLAKTYDIPKKQLVLLKMQGNVDQNDLLIGLRTAKLTGADLQQLLILRDGKHSWQEILSAPDLAGRVKSDPLLGKIPTGLPDADAGRQAADLLLAEFFTIPPATIDKLRAAGLNEKELALILILAHRKSLPPETIAARYQKEGKSWGEIADSLGIAPAAAGKFILDYPAKK